MFGGSGTEKVRTRAAAAAIDKICEKYPFGARPLVKAALVSHATIIVMYAEKGGVGKTTQSGTLAWGLADRGYKVLIYDCDAQRSLSNWLLSQRIAQAPFNEDYNEYVNRVLDGPDNARPRTLFQQLEPVRNQQLQVQAAYPELVRENLWIVPGDRNIVEYDAYIAAADALIQVVPGQANLMGAPYHAMVATAALVDADYIVVDLNPSRGVLNRCLVSTAHYLITPVIADFFSNEMLRDLAANMIAWQAKMAQLAQVLAQQPPAQQAAITHPVPHHVCHFMGYILSRYKILPGTQLGQVQNNGLTDDHMTPNEAAWALRADYVIQDSRRLLLSHVPPMCIPDEAFATVGRRPCIGRVSEYHQLAALSGLFNRPVAFLEREHMINPMGAMSNAREVFENVQRFRRIAFATVETIIALVANAPHQPPFQ